MPYACRWRRDGTVALGVTKHVWGVTEFITHPVC
jgi:hypothetical protein